VTRVFFFALLTVGVGSVSASCMDVEVAPPPREVRPDGTRDPAPEQVVTKAQNPLETVERIIKNSKDVGDKLAMTDIGTNTRKTQDTILKDIQSLIDQQENPPPPKPDQNQDMNKDQNENKPNNKDKKNDMMPMPGMDEMPPQKKDMQQGGGMDQQPMNGTDQPKGRKPRQQSGDQPKEQGSKPMDPGKSPGGKGMGKEHAAAAKDSKQGTGQLPDPMSKGEKPPTTPSIPPEEAAVKDVWGYLPDKLRLQAMQYYKQEFMPRYTKLLEHYYSSLSEKSIKK
jgi:hypothetical protein